MTHISLATALFPVLLFGCYLSHSSVGDDDTRDGGLSDSSVPLFDGATILAPVCLRAPRPPCLSAAEVAVVPMASLPSRGAIVQDVISDGFEARVLALGLVAPTSYEARWRVYSVGMDGAVTTPIELVSTSFDEEASGDLDIVDGLLVASLRGQTTHDDIFTGYETRGVVWRSADLRSFDISAPMHTSMEGAAGTAVLRNGDIVWYASELGDSIGIGPAGAEAIVAIPAPNVLTPLRVGRVAGGTAFVWSEVVDDYRVSTRGAFVASDGSVVGPHDIFGATPRDAPAASVISDADSTFVARFERVSDSLMDSRLRVARLDDHMRRSEPDRWFTGWGGLKPQGVAMARFRGVSWLLWRSLDPRYGTHPVLFAHPILEEACGVGSIDPLLIWSGGPNLIRGFALTADADAMWLAIGGDPVETALTVYRLTVCEEG